MLKRSNRPNVSKTSPNLKEVQENYEDTKIDNAKFRFQNGDVYEGEFRILNRKAFYKQGYGVYITDNFDIYSAQWDQDNIASDLHIQYNNGMQYKGEINVKGEMTGFGMYIFPDGSSVEGNWNENKPQINANFVDPSGFKWKGLQSETGKEILFEPGNHFWRELYGTVNDKEDEMTLNQEIFDKPPSKLSLKNKKWLKSLDY